MQGIVLGLKAEAAGASNTPPDIPGFALSKSAVIVVVSIKQFFSFVMREQVV